MFVACLSDARVRARSNIIEIDGLAVVDREGEELTCFDDQLDFDASVFAATSEDAWIITPKGDTASCVDGPRPARDFVARGAIVACSHVSGLLMQSGWTAGPDGFREPRPHHSSGIDVPMKRQVSLDCVGSTDCAITLHCLSQALARSSAVYAAAAIRW